MAKSPGAWGRLTRAAIFLRGPAGQTVLDGSREVAWYFRTVPYLPPQVIGLLLALAGVAGVALMVGMRVAMRRDLEPLSSKARWAMLAMLAVAGAGGYLLYVLATRALDR